MLIKESTEAVCVSTCEGCFVQEHHVKFEKYKMQDALIQEEEEGQRMDKNKAAAKAASEREKKQRKKVMRTVMLQVDISDAFRAVSHAR